MNTNTVRSHVCVFKSILIICCIWIFTVSAYAQTMSVNLVVTHNITCNGGSDGEIIAVINGGMQPYSYQWSNNNQSLTNSNLGQGNYTITVTDANGFQSQVKTVSTSLSQPAQMYIDLSSTSVSSPGLADGSATVNSVPGGTSPFSYAWSPYGGYGETASNLSEGTFEVLVTDGLGCAATKTISVAAPNASGIVVTGILEPTCSNSADGAISVIMNSSAAHINYYWTPYGGFLSTATGLAPGLYTVYAYDSNGNYYSKEITLYGPDELTASYQFSQITCHGANDGSINMNVNGGTQPYSYDWVPNVANTPNIMGLSPGMYQCKITDANGCSKMSNIIQIAQSFMLMSLNTSVLSNASCSGVNDGAANVQISGGQGPYTISWQPSGKKSTSVTGLSAGVHTVTVTDAYGCELTESVAISGPTNEMVIDTITVNNISCQGLKDGSASITVSGGTAPYMYQWNPMVSVLNTSSNLDLGTYEVIVTDANGCTASDKFDIINSAYLNEEITTVDNLTFCARSSANLTLTGVPGNTYKWLRYNNYTGDTGLNKIVRNTGNYRVEVTTPNGCIYFTKHLRTVRLLNPDATIDKTGVIEFCANQPEELNANTGPGLEYMWYKYGRILAGETSSKLITNKSGRYKVVVKDTNGCQSTSKPVRLIALSRMKVNLIAQGPTELCSGDSIIIQSTVRGGYAPYTYQWVNYKKKLNGETKDYLIRYRGGSYKVYVTDSKGCIYGSRGRLKVHNISCKIMNELPEQKPERDINQKLDISVYPNPFRESINVVIPTYSEESIEIRISDLFGRRIYANTFPGAYEYEISVKGVDNGYYIMEVIQGNRSGRVKMLKQ